MNFFIVSKFFVLLLIAFPFITNAQCPYFTGALMDALATGTPAGEGKTNLLHLPQELLHWL